MGAVAPDVSHGKEEGPRDEDIVADDVLPRVLRVREQQLKVGVLGQQIFDAPVLPALPIFRGRQKQAQ